MQSLEERLFVNLRRQLYRHGLHQHPNEVDVDNPNN